MCRTLKVNHKTRHINLRIHYIRELINSKVINLIFVPSELNVADVLTKALGAELHNKHSNILIQGHNGFNINNNSNNYIYVMDE